MKKLLFVIFFIINLNVIAQTKITTTDRCKIAIRKNLSLTMNDFKSYQPVSWGKIEVVYFNFTDTDEGKILLDSANYWLKEAEWWVDASDLRKSAVPNNYKTDSIFLSNLKRSNFPLKKANYFNDILVVKEKSFKKYILLYKINHTFRGKNAYGAYVINSYKFLLNDDFSIYDEVDLND